MTLRQVPPLPARPVPVPQIKVTHLTSVHAAGDPRILLKECATLAAAGYDVTLVARADRDHRRRGVQVRALRLPRNRLRRLLVTVPAVYRAARATDADLYHFHDPELIGVGMLLRARGKAVVYDVHEDLPRQVLAKHWVPGPLRRPLSVAAGVAEAAAGRAVSRVVAATPTIAERFPAGRTVLVRNYPQLGEFAGVERPWPRPETAAAVYVGGIVRARGAVQMVTAAHLLARREHPVRLDLAGPVWPAALLDELAAIPGWSSVRYHGFVDRTAVAGLLRSASVGLVTLLPTPSHVDALPVKLFEYMAAGLPVVASDFPLWRSIVSAAGCGLLVDPADPAAIAEAVAWVVDHPGEAVEMGARGLAAARASYDWDVESGKLLDCYRGLVGPPPTAALPAVPPVRRARTTWTSSSRYTP